MPQVSAAVPSAARTHLDHAARLALRGAGRVEPNPIVGAVLVKDGQVIGQGHHRHFGGQHAEREALTDCRSRGHSSTGATLYTTLEPCAHHGKTPPCTDALIEARIARVVAATKDPNPHAGGGAEILRQAGIECEFSDESSFARAINAPFVKRITAGMPWVLAKWAQTIDGRIATRNGESKWISGPAARRRVHRLRGRVDAILTGLGTVRVDDPLLTAREGPPPRRLAKRILVDPQLQIPARSRLVQSAREVPTLIACSETAYGWPSGPHKHLVKSGIELLPLPPGPGGLDLGQLFRQLAQHHQISTIMVEAGATLLGSLFHADLIDQAVVYIAPMILGDDRAKPVASGGIAETLHQARRLELCRVNQLAGDVELVYLRKAGGTHQPEPR
jgi:diaminohydroxyphosphoribosylaminopyrimidine deaminase / 5-amino-6-(5-phosphoribosylamino)uracil reductase